MLNAAGITGLLAAGGGGSQGSSSQANVSSGELRDLKLKLARKEKENKELREQLEELKKTGVSKASTFNDI